MALEHDDEGAGSGRPPGPVDPGPGGPGRTRRRGRKRTWAKRAIATLLILVGLVAAAFVVLTRTHPGQRLVLRETLKRLQGAVNGRIVVDDIRSRDLLDGVTLAGVRIEGPEGDPFFLADSVSATYAWRTFLSGDVILSSLDVHQPVLLVTREPGEELFNADIIFQTGQEPDTAAGGLGQVIFHDVTLLDGTVRVTYPEEGPIPERALTVETPGGETLRRLAFDEIHAGLSRVLVSTPDIEGPRVTVEDLSAVARMYEDPVRLGDLEGIVTWADSRLTVEAETVEVGQSRASGTVVADFGGDEMVLTLDVETPEARLADFQWIEPRLPEGTATGGVRLEIRPSELRWHFEGMAADLGESDIRADGGWVLAGEEMSFDGLDLELSPLDLDRVGPWIETELPLEGTVRGTATLDGTLDRLRAEGHLTLQEPGTGGPPTTADFAGLFHLDEELGVTDLRATVDPLDYDLVTKLFPGATISGSGRARIEATGRVETGVRFNVDGVHRDEGVPTSMLVAEGSVREVGGELVLDVTADAGPLSLTALRRYYPELPFSGEVRGLIRAVGPLSDLSLTTDLETEAGRLALESRFDARDPTASYEVRGDVSRFRLSALVPALPDPTVLSGNVRLSGRGADLATADIDARLRARQSRVGDLAVDTAAVSLRISDGVLTVDTLDAVVGGVDVRGSGRLAVREDGPEGEVRIAFETDSVAGLRPLLLGDTVIAQDTLTALERGRLVALEGIDPDSLPTTDEIALTGAASGEVVLRGSLESFSAEGQLSLDRIAYDDHFLRDASVTFSAGELPSLEGELHAELQADSLQLFGRAFQQGTLDLDYTRPEGRFDLFLARSDEEDYRARAIFDVDTLGGRVQLEEMALRFDTLSWELADTATVDWDGRGVTVRGLELVRPGPDPMRVVASGTIPREGDADFTLDVEGLELQRLTQLAQREDLDLSGRVAAHLEIEGTAAAPVITGTLMARDLSYQSFDLSRLEGDIGYRDRRVSIDLDAWRDDLQVLTASGTIPADLALTGVEDRFPPEEIDLRVVADSLPATFVLGVVQSVEEVTGTVDGEFTIAGTVEDPSPTGTLALEGAGFLLPALGVRYQDVRGTLALQPDGTVEVDASARAGGSVDVTGTVALEPLTNPTFDLLIDLQGFRAVARRDVEGVVSGQVTLTGTFQYPRVQGLESEGRGLVVDRGTIFLEEFQRSATVVDLSDPRFIDLEESTLARAQDVIAESQNPFLRNLILNVDLAVEQDTWLRSGEMNVEMEGDLVVVFERRQNEIVLVGELEAVRGDYTILGRRFDVQEGLVEFVGTPGINPNLQISAQTSVRRPDNPPLEITATVTGTLVNPRVELSSPDVAAAEEDLISYLLFGQPTYALTTGQAASVQGAATRLTNRALGLGFGTLTSQLGTLVAREVGLDYFAISQPTDVVAAGFAGTVQQTTVELGRYIDDDLFLVLVVQPFQSASTTGSIFAGGRLEWTGSDAYTIELFVEDRFLRSGALGFQNLGLEATLIFGASIAWEWGY